MKRRILPIVVVAGFMTIGASPTLADPGTPGTTFPEQPGTHVQTACTAVTTNPGQAFSHAAPNAVGTLMGLIEDACLPG